jgi:hypothetical protein
VTPPTPPIIPKFPEPPKDSGATEKCPDLELLNNGAKLSDVSVIINDNYTTYKDCANKVDIWLEWYSTNKNNYEKIGK